VTGKGEVLDIFKNVVPALLYLDNVEMPQHIEFEASGESRGRVELYDRLARTYSYMRTEFSVDKTTNAAGDTKFVLRNYEPSDVQLSFPAGISLAFCPTGEGGKVDNSCSPENKGTGKPKIKRQPGAKGLEEAANKIKFNDIDQVSDLNYGELPLDTWTRTQDYYDFDPEDEDSEEEILVSVEYRMPFMVGDRRFTLAMIDELDGYTDIQFEDDKGKMEISGEGGAHEVFSKVAVGVESWIKKQEPSGLSFSAQGRSRIKLYDRLARTLSARHGYKIKRDLKDDGIVAMANYILEK
jgi:hypothetical protein